MLTPSYARHFRSAATTRSPRQGSCFAQHISRTLVKQRYQFLVTEHYVPAEGVSDENFGVFPARFGNIYTARQLLQLIERAYGERQDTQFWPGRRDVIIDPFRPTIQSKGFGTVEFARLDRERHLSAVRTMFEQCDVFVFTLGLTEAWEFNDRRQCVSPGPWRSFSEAKDTDYRFHNFSVAEVVRDMLAALDRLFAVNPSVKVILTVSPVALIATYEDRHVLVSTVASKSILRAAADEIFRQRPSRVSYFPSYEIITGPQSGGRYFAPDLRDVTPEGVAYVMSLFSKHYLAAVPNTDSAAEIAAATGGELTAEDEQRMAEISAIICDEEEIVR